MNFLVSRTLRNSRLPSNWYEDLRRPADHAAAFRRGRVSTSCRDPDGRERLVGLLEDPPQLIQGADQISLDVVVEGLEGGDVEHAGVSCCPIAANQLMDRPEKGRQRLSAPCRRSDEEVLPGGDQRPGLRLQVGGPPEAFQEPFGDHGVEMICESSMRLVPSGFVHRLPRATFVTWRKKGKAIIPGIPCCSIGTLLTLEHFKHFNKFYVFRDN